MNTDRTITHILDALTECIAKRGNIHDATDVITEKIITLKNVKEQMSFIDIIYGYDKSLIRLSEIYFSENVSQELRDHILKKHYLAINEDELLMIADDYDDDERIKKLYEVYVSSRP